MADDYSLDPLQVQEDELNALYKRALARTVRQKWDPNDLYGSASRNTESVLAERELGSLSQKKLDLSGQMQQRMAESLRGVPAELAAGYRDPGSRAEFAKQLAKFRENEMVQNKLTELRGQYGPGVSGTQTISGGGTGDNPYGLAKAASENPYTHEIGKAMMSNQVVDPTKAQRNPDGSISPLGGALDTIRQQERAKTMGADAPINIEVNGTIVPHRRNNDGSLTPIPFGAGGPPPSAPPSAPLGGALAAASGPNPAASAPPTGGSALPGATIAAFGQPQSMTTRMAIFQQEVKENYDNLAQGRASGDEQMIRIATQNLRELDREIKLVQRQHGPTGGQVPSGYAAQGQPQPEQSNADRGFSALPNATAATMPPSRIPEQPAVGKNPGQEFRGQEFYKTQQDELKKIQEAQREIPTMLNQLDQLEATMKKPIYGGGRGAIAGGVNWAGNTISKTPVEDPQLANTRTFESLIKEMAGPRAKLLGYNPSNFDLSTAIAQLPTLGDSPGSRAEVVKRLRDGLDYQMQSVPVIQELVAAGRTVPEAMKYFHEAVWPQIKAQKEQQQRNPTEAPGAQSALPGATSAAGAAALPRGMPPSAPLSEGPGVADFLTSKLGWSAMGRSAAALPGSLASEGGSAAWDTLSNVARGAGQWAGLSNREDWAAEKARQDEKARTNPKYAQARDLTDITANPINYIPGSTLPKMIAAGAAQGLTQPGSTAGEQLMQGVTQAGLSGVTGVAARAIPSTQSVAKDVGPEVTRLLREYPSVKATSAQLNPDILGSKLVQGAGGDVAAALAQQKGLTKELMKRAGIEGERLTPKILTDAKSAMSTEYEGMFKNNVFPKIPTTTATELRTAMQRSPDLQPLMAGSQPLATVYAAIMSGNATKVSAATLHQAWKDIGQVATDNPTSAQAAGQARKILEDIIANAMPQGDRGVFRNLNKRWGATEDVERVFLKSGGGEGAAYGTISPAKLKTEQSRGPNTGGVTDEAVQLVDALRMRNAIPNQDVPTSLKDIAQRIAGPVVHVFDKNAVNAPPLVRKMLDLLRTGIAKGAPLATEEFYNAP